MIYFNLFFCSLEFFPLLVLRKRGFWSTWQDRLYSDILSYCVKKKKSNSLYPWTFADVILFTLDTQQSREIIQFSAVSDVDQLYLEHACATPTYSWAYLEHKWLALATLATYPEGYQLFVVRVTLDQSLRPVKGPRHWKTPTSPLRSLICWVDQCRALERCFCFQTYRFINAQCVLTLQHGIFDLVRLNIIKRNLLTVSFSQQYE